MHATRWWHRDDERWSAECKDGAAPCGHRPRQDQLSKNVPALVVALGGQPGTDIIDLLTQHYCGDASYPLEREIESSGVEYRFSNYS
jgi:hypothetical protein